MDITLFIPLLISWIVKTFPSMGDYVEYIGPAIMVLTVILGIFTNLLPLPGYKFKVPDTQELEIALAGNGAYILKMAYFARSIVIGINWFIATGIYYRFYTWTNIIAQGLSRIKLAPKPVQK